LPSDLVISLEGISPLNWASVGANAIVAVLSLIGGVALLLVRPWAWTLALLVQGYSLAVDLWGVYQGRTPYLEMLIPIVIIFYLNTRSVSRFFESLRHRTEVRPHTTPVVLNTNAGPFVPGANAVVPTLTPTQTQPDQQPVRHESATRT
jgi:ABC-type multidrug transport system fused ATPase/permease subunit